MFLQSNTRFDILQSIQMSRIFFRAIPLMKKTHRHINQQSFYQIQIDYPKKTTKISNKNRINAEIIDLMVMNLDKKVIKAFSFCFEIISRQIIFFMNFQKKSQIYSQVKTLETDFSFQLNCIQEEGIQENTQFSHKVAVNLYYQCLQQNEILRDRVVQLECLLAESSNQIDQLQEQIESIRKKPIRKMSI